MLTCYLQGGLGNQLFEIFTTIAYALKHKKPFAFTNKSRVDTLRSTYWHSFLSPLAKFTKDFDYYKLNAVIFKEKEFAYNELPAINANNILLDGYFQSYKYFDHDYKNIIKLIKLDEQKEKIRLKYYLNYNIHNTISLHIRQGDYKYLQHSHPLMTYDYYYNSLTHIVNNKPPTQEQYHVLIFCEKNDFATILPMIERLRESFPTLTFQIIDFSIPDWEQMLLMSLCQHNIIANSSFSWWGAYFNVNPNKIVCYPSNWFGPRMQNCNTIDLFPSFWQKV